MSMNKKKTSNLLAFSLNLTLIFLLWLVCPFLIVFFLGEYLETLLKGGAWLRFALYGLAFIVSSIGLAYCSCRAMSYIDKEVEPCLNDDVKK